MKWKMEKIQQRLNEVYDYHSNNGEAKVKFRAEEFYNEFGDNEETFEEWLTETKHPQQSAKRAILQSMPERFVMRSSVETREKPVGYSTDEHGEIWFEVEMKENLE